MANNEQKPKRQGKRIGGDAAKWKDGEEVQGNLVSVVAAETRYGQRALVTIEVESGDHREYYMPQGWVARLTPVIGKRIGVARDGAGFEARYDVRLL